MKTGHFYHVYNRGNNSEKIFKEEKNYAYFLKRFQDYLSEWVEVYAYCLMPNHFHLLVKIPDFPESTGGLNPVEKAFKNFFTSYAKAINKNYGRTGSLFQSNYKKKLIETDEQLAINVTYIHFNPVKAKLTHHYSEWPHCSYYDLIGQHQTFLQRSFCMRSKRSGILE